MESKYSHRTLDLSHGSQRGNAGSHLVLRCLVLETFAYGLRASYGPTTHACRYSMVCFLPGRLRSLVHVDIVAYWCHSSWMCRLSCRLLDSASLSYHSYVYTVACSSTCSHRVPVSLRSISDREAGSRLSAEYASLCAYAQKSGGVSARCIETLLCRL